MGFWVIALVLNVMSQLFVFKRTAGGLIMTNQLTVIALIRCVLLS